MATFINLADLVDPKDPQRRTYRQINAAKQHSFPVGSLVEDTETGFRLFVVYHGRDCDMTPLYWLCHDPDDTEKRDPRFANPKWVGGWGEEHLRLIR